MRRLYGLLCAAAIGCGGGDGGAPRSFEEVPGLEGELVWFVTLASDGDVVMLRGLTDRLALRYDGSRLDAITGSPTYKIIRATSGPTFHPYLLTEQEVYRVDGTAMNEIEPTFDRPLSWLAADAAGGLYLQDAAAAMFYRAPGASDWSPHPSTVARVNFNGMAAYDTEGAIWGYSAVDQMQGVIRVDATGVTQPFDCNRQELSFCASEGIFATGAPGEPVMQASGGRFYSVAASGLAVLAEPPPDDPFVVNFTRGADGKLYIVAAKDNLSVTEHHLYVLDGSTWKLLAIMPGFGEVVVDQTGNVYAGITPVNGQPGGFWKLPR